MTGVKANKVPPDGGYGWIVTFAYALNNVVVLPLIAGFGLIFKEAFDDTQMTATQGTLVITLNHGIGMLLSFFSGPVLKRFGYRKVAVVGALFIFLGLVITSIAKTFWVFVLSYSIINSMGVAAVMAAFSLAINSFFKEKRGRAIGLGMSITGLGAIYMPILMSTLMNAYGWRYAVLILSSICLHSLLGACLLRPAKWYLRYPPQNEEEMVPLNNENNVHLANSNITDTLPELNIKIEEVTESNGFPPKSMSMRSLTSNASLNSRNAISHPDVRKKVAEPPLAESRYKWWESQEINLGSSLNIFNETGTIKKVNAEDREFSEKVEPPQSFVDKLINFFDLKLLADPIFINILIGMSVAGCVETNFSLLLPIMLTDMMKFQTEEIAYVMSIIGFSDTLFRVVSPFIGEWCHKPPRVMYTVSLLIVVFIRTIMLFTTSLTGMFFVAFALGVTKGVRTVYMNIIIPSYVPLERLPFASGIQMFLNGIIIITIGALLGRVREMSGSYNIPIIILNVVSLITVILWSMEFIYFKIKKNSQEELK